MGGCRRIFYKGVGKNLAQHKANEIFLKYKLEAYQKNFLDFISSNPTSIKVLGHDEETKVGPNGRAQEEEVQIKESKDFRSGAIKKEV